MKPERISEIDGKPLEEWRQHLLDAAVYMEKRGHCKRRLEALPSGSVCLVGSLWKTKESHGRHYVAVERLAKYLKLSEPAEVPDWNDRPETTKEMAVNALIGAALSK